jgi:hypothetical protein
MKPALLILLSGLLCGGAAGLVIVIWSAWVMKKAQVKYRTTLKLHGKTYTI